MTRPREQWPIIAPKGERTQDHWLIGCFADSTFTLRYYHPDDCQTVINIEPRPYSELWTALAELPKTKAKTWLIGNRMRYALERADFLGALAAGQVHLPTKKKPGKTPRRGGKLAYSLNCLEIDLVCGKNPIKVLDWKNYGIEPEPGGHDLTPQYHQAAWQRLHDYLNMARMIGLRVNKSTAAQIGWQHARIDHAPPVLMYNLDPLARAMERRAYYGGRNEAYKLGDIPDAVLSLDVKASYASICRQCKVPIYMEEEYPTGLDHRDIKYDDQTHWIADVVISTPEADYPLRHDGQVIYPIGQFFTTLAWPELYHALARARVVKITRAARYRADFALRSYAQWYSRSRDQVADSSYAHMAPALKAAFNGSLGYTARQRYELQPWKMDLDRDWWLGYTSAPDKSAAVVHAQVLAGIKEWLRVGGEPREAMPFLHATICSWARLQLLNIFQAAGREWIYYCDTDGILVDYRGYANLLDTPGMIGEEPGQLGERFKSGPCRIQGQKNYKIGANIICAGLIRTRHSEWQQKEVLTTPTGRTDSEGRVTPFELKCDAIDGEAEGWVNAMA